MRLTFLLLALIPAAIAADHDTLTGSWQLDPAKSQFGRIGVKSETISISQKPDAVEIDDAVTADNGKEEKLTYTCAPSGEVCKAKHGVGDITLYYNGPLLVMIETKHGGDWVVKRRISASDDGKTLKMEVERLAPPNQKNDNLVFVKQ